MAEGVVYTFNNIEFGYEQMNGSFEYFGATPINIKPNTPNYYNKVRVLSKNYNSSDVNKDYRRQQAMALYNNYLFCFEDNYDGTGHCQVFNFNTLNNNSEPICSFSIAGSHANSAEFTNTFYDSDDEFPLLLISYFYPGNKAGLFRIVRNGNYFTGTLVKEILLNGNKFTPSINYGSSFTINYTTNKLYVFMPQERWDDHYYKPILAYSFQLPSIMDVSGDIEQSFEIPWFVLQSVLILNGLIYIPCDAPNASPFMGYTGSLLIVADLCGFVVKNIVPLNNSLEAEGLVASNNDIYISFRNSVATEGNLAFIIEKYMFQ